MDTFSRLLRVINVGIGVLLILLIFLGYRYVWRALPQTSGEVTAPLSADATIVRDALGVPHITAATWQDAYFLQGYVTAQDRLWQMDATRRVAAGELAEVVGARALPADLEARRLRLSQMAQEQERVLNAEARQAFGAYARGVNHFIETHRDVLPIEFRILGYEPRPWRVRDTLLAGLEMTRRLTTSYNEELHKATMLRGNRAKVEELYEGGLAVSPGSNAWAISGAHTKSGKPLLANDPHLGLSLPSTWYMVHMKAGDMDVTGASLPGVPAVIIGHNARIAWGMTNLEFDMQDLYREQMDARTGAYLFQGQARAADVVSMPIAVKGGEAVSFVSLATVHGPVTLNDESGTYALRWLVPANGEFAFLGLNRARNWAEFNAALERFAGPPQNFVYADVEGNIGYHAAGMIPLRRPGCGGDVPSEGAVAQCEWLGIVPYAELPQVYNPPSGIVVTANQNPFANARYPVAGVFAPDYRAQQIRARLAKKDKWSAEELLDVQKDVYSSFLHFVAQQTLQAWERKPSGNATAAAAVEVLKPWNGQMEIGQAAPYVASLLYAELRDRLAEIATPGNSGLYTSRFASPVIERLLRKRPAGWVKDYDEFLVEVLGKAVATGAQVQGSNVARWDYGQSIEAVVKNPVLGEVPVVGSYFNVGPVPMSGASSTVKQISGGIAPSYRMVVDMANLDASLANIPVGQSAHVLSKHYRDQFDAYYVGDSFPMQFGKVAGAETLHVRAR
jgi:penicillin G amidase